jgi:hypothetical protein
MEAPSEVMPKAQDAAALAREINGREGAALSVMACIKSILDWDYPGAETLFRKALESQPGSGPLEQLYCDACACANGAI